MTTTGDSRLRGPEFERLLRQEEFILDVALGLGEALEKAGMTKAELARRLNRSPGFVSQVLQGGRNLTLRTVADVAAALSLRPSLALSPASQPAVATDSWPAERWPDTPPASAVELSSGPESAPAERDRRRARHTA